jgi:hypothetical protein
MFADMPLDNRTVDHIAAVAARLTPLGSFEKRHRSTKRSKISSRLIVL